MTEPKARAAESGRQSEVHVTARRSPRSGERATGAPFGGSDSTRAHGWMGHQ
jgi:hypothetical protein